MTFDKYNHRITGWGSVVFPNNGYLYEYIHDKDKGWIQIRGKKIEDLPEQEWDVFIPKEVN